MSHEKQSDWIGILKTSASHAYVEEPEFSLLLCIVSTSNCVSKIDWGVFKSKGQIFNRKYQVSCWHLDCYNLVFYINTMWYTVGLLQWFATSNKILCDISCRNKTAARRIFISWKHVCFFPPVNIVWFRANTLIHCLFSLTWDNYAQLLLFLQHSWRVLISYLTGVAQRTRKNEISS